MSLGVEHEDGVIDDRLDQLLVSVSIEPAGCVALRHRLSLNRVLAGHGLRTREARLLIPAELGGSDTTCPIKCDRQRAAPAASASTVEVPMWPIQRWAASTVSDGFVSKRFCWAADYASSALVSGQDAS